jgi:hypothetical protein
MGGCEDLEGGGGGGGEAGERLESECKIHTSQLKLLKPTGTLHSTKHVSSQRQLLLTNQLKHTIKAYLISSYIDESEQTTVRTSYNIIGPARRRSTSLEDWGWPLCRPGRGLDL